MIIWKYLFLVLGMCTTIGTYSQSRPIDIHFDTTTIYRKANFGDNWCQTWAIDDQIYTMMDDGNGWWGSSEKLTGLPDWEGAMLLQISGNQNFTDTDVRKMPGWPINLVNSPLYAYGILAVDSTIYIWLWKSETDFWYQRPVANRLLYTEDFGKSIYRWDGTLETHKTYGQTESSAFFFYKEDPRAKDGRDAYAFNWIAFLQNGKANSAAKDDYVYMYSPDQDNPRYLALARVKKDEILNKSEYEYFRGMFDDIHTWTSDISQRGYTFQFPAAGEDEEWMWDGWCHNCSKPGSIGFWYSETPWGSWNEFYYEDAFLPDDTGSRTYGVKLSPKWISEDGKRMVLIWSDAGYDHSIYYKWNQMEVEILID